MRVDRDVMTRRVDAEGNIRLPAGNAIVAVKVAGLSEGEATLAVSKIYAPANPAAGYVPNVKVRVQSMMLRDVVIQGAVRAPGRYPLPDEEEASLSLLDLIMKAGGLKETSDAQHIRIVSINPDGSTHNRVVSIDDLLRGRVPNVVLQLNDNVFVPASPPP